VILEQEPCECPRLEMAAGPRRSSRTPPQGPQEAGLVTIASFGLIHLSATGPLGLTGAGHSNQD
jgi:hypothetical protein